MRPLLLWGPSATNCGINALRRVSSSLFKEVKRGLNAYRENATREGVRQISMDQKWRKLGRLYCPSNFGRHSKLASHAANPLPIHLGGNIYRIFYCGRDINNRSSVGAVDIDIRRLKIVREHLEPFFEYGSPDSFYPQGVSIGNVYRVNKDTYILFMGWNHPHDGQWRGTIGRLKVNPDFTLNRNSGELLLGRDEIDPLSLSYPWVLKMPSGEYRMWYGSTRSWDIGNREMLHVIHGASSVDGNNWIREGLVVPFILGKAQAFSRPNVLANSNGSFDMWLSYKGGNGVSYRIGYASSENGTTWKLELDKSGISVSEAGWDSQMIAYPHVFEHLGERYMLYNGNGYGRTGFGLAVME